MSASLSTLREAILYTWCLTGTTIRRCTRHVLASQNIAVYITLPPCLAFISDFALEWIRPAELLQHNIMKWVGPITHHLFRHCFGVWVPPNAFDMETQNPRADMSVLPTLANFSITQRSRLSSSGDQAPWNKCSVSCKQYWVGDVPVRLVSLYCTCWRYRSLQSAGEHCTKSATATQALPCIWTALHWRLC